jgi:hypothetical protein
VADSWEQPSATVSPNQRAVGNSQVSCHAERVQITLWADVRNDLRGGVDISVTDDEPHRPVAVFTFMDVDGRPVLHEFKLKTDDGERQQAPHLSVRLMRDLPLQSWETAAKMFWVRRRASHLPVQGGQSERFLETVAEDYRTFLARGERSPAKAIAEKYGSKPATARSWIYRARLAGLLGPADSTRSGEATLPGTPG